MNMSVARVFLFVLLIMPFGAAAQTEATEENKPRTQQYVYQWTDDQGMVHMTDTLDKVPRKYRIKARAIKSAPGASGTAEGDEVRVEPGTTPPSDEQFQSNLRQEEWQLKYQGWKDKQKEAEKRYQKLEQRRGSLIMRWGAPAVAPMDVRLEVEQIDNEMQTAQKEIAEARHMLEDVLPDEARKAGIPPGWLRE